MRPARLLPGDCLVHHANPKTLVDHLVQGPLTWGEWTGAPKEDLSACHVEVVLDETRIAKMNPKVSDTYLLADAPWDNIVVYRPDFAILAAMAVPRFPGEDPRWVDAFKADCLAHLGEPYGWGTILRFTGAGLLARIWPAAGRWLLSKQNTAVSADGHGAVCSVWATMRVEHTTRQVYTLPTFDLFAGTGIGDDAERPADFSRSVYLRLVKEDGTV